MCSTITLRNIVGVAENAFLESIIPLQRYFHSYAIVTLSLEVEHLVNRGFGLVKEIYEST